MAWHILRGPVPGSKYPGVACRAGGGLARGAGGGVADPCPTCWHLAAPPPPRSSSGKAASAGSHRAIARRRFLGKILQ